MGMLSENKKEYQNKNILLSDRVYDTLIRRAILENKIISEQYGIVLDCNEIYQESVSDFDEDRQLSIKRVSFPTFHVESKQLYYDVYLVDISFWRLGELPRINQEVMDLRPDRYLSDSRTLFITGCLYGHVEPRHIMRYKLRVFNVKNFEERQWDVLFQTLHNFLDFRCMKMSKGGRTFGHVEKDNQRMMKLAGFFLDMSKINNPMINMGGFHHF